MVILYYWKQCEHFHETQKKMILSNHLLTILPTTLLEYNKARLCRVLMDICMELIAHFIPHTDIVDQ